MKALRDISPLLFWWSYCVALFIAAALVYKWATR